MLLKAFSKRILACHGGIGQAILIYCGFMASFIVSTPVAANPITLLFYSSESNINNFKTLKMDFDIYLSAYGPYQFQPFSTKETFESQIKCHKDCLVILSSWHFRNIAHAYELQPMLVGVRKGKKYQKRLLLAKGVQVTANAKQSIRVASASSTQFTLKTLTEITEVPFEKERIKLLAVPKDIDGLMSVGYGMSDMALTTDFSFNKLLPINSVLYNDMKIIGKSKESMLLIVAIPKSFNKDSQGIIRLLRQMHETPAGRTKIRLLGLDAWQDIDKTDITFLERHL